MSFRYDMRDKSPQQQAIVRERDRNDKLLRQNSSIKHDKYLKAKEDACIRSCHFTKGKIYKINDENDFDYSILCDEGVSILINMRNGELEHFELIEE